MFERSAIVVLLLALAARPAAAQHASDSTAVLRQRLAEVEVQLARRNEARRAENARTPGRTGRILSEGNFTVIVRATVSRDTIVRLASSADSILAAFGVIPDSFVRTIVHVMPFVTDDSALLASPELRNRRRASFEWSGEAPGVSLGNGWLLAQPVVRAFRETTDSVWLGWLDNYYGSYWVAKDDGEAAITMLTNPQFATGNECLAGRLRSCRLWLGVDADSQPYLVRYKTDELLREARGRMVAGGADGAACRQGEVDACVRVFKSRPWLRVSPIPAPEQVRGSLMRAVRELHGSAAVRLALADRHGSVGERLSRAAGVPEDSLMAEWRRWVLGRGRMERVSAGVGDVTTALLFSALLIGLAARSGRWR